MTEFAALPQRVVVGANGAYWRDFGDHYSVCPVSTDNDPIEVAAVFVPLSDEDDIVEEMRELRSLLAVVQYDHRKGNLGAETEDWYDRYLERQLVRRVNSRASEERR